MANIFPRPFDAVPTAGAWAAGFGGPCICYHDGHSSCCAATCACSCAVPAFQGHAPDGHPPPHPLARCRHCVVPLLPRLAQGAPHHPRLCKGVPPGLLLGKTAEVPVLAWGCSRSALARPCCRGSPQTLQRCSPQAAACLPACHTLPLCTQPPMPLLSWPPPSPGAGHGPTVGREGGSPHGQLVLGQGVAPRGQAPHLP